VSPRSDQEADAEVLPDSTQEMGRISSQSTRHRPSAYLRPLISRSVCAHTPGGMLNRE
jgi:hypothetical protein